MKKFLKSVFKFTGLMCIILGVVFGTVYLWSVLKGEAINLPEIKPFETVAAKKTKNVLVAALHTEGPLTDFIMVVQYNPETKRAAALSIPRDTKVIGTIDGKINSAYARKKDINDLIDKVKEVTSLSIDNYVLLETNVVAQMVDEIGGITYDVPMDMKYDDNSQDLHIDISKGKQTLNGSDVVKFLRFRKNNEGTIAWGDIQRINAQQNFIKEAVAQVLTPKIILKLPEIIKLGLSLVKTDLGINDILDYIDDVSKFNTENLTMKMLPGDAKYIDGISYYVADSEKTKKLIDEMFFNDTPCVENDIETVLIDNEDIKTEDSQKEDIKIEILNSNSDDKLLKNAIKLLKKKGYNVVRSGEYKTTTDKSTTIINRCNNNTFSEDIKSIIGSGVIINEDKTYNSIDLTLILGNDY